jgi:hypothetical protein
VTRQFGFFSALIVVAASLWQAPASADSLWAEKTGWVDYGFGQLQHTYVCYRSGSKKRCYGNPGGNSGGSYLSRTSGVGSGSKVVCAKGGSCAIRWGFTGTCHQGANRMLKTASKTVSAAGGYSISVRLFGTYGPATSWNYCRAYCGI